MSFPPVFKAALNQAPDGFGARNLRVLLIDPGIDSRKAVLGEPHRRTAGRLVFVTMKPTRGASSPGCHSTLAITRRGLVPASARHGRLLGSCGLSPGARRPESGSVPARVSYRSKFRRAGHESRRPFLTQSGHVEVGAGPLPRATPCWPYHDAYEL